MCDTYKTAWTILTVLCRRVPVVANVERYRGVRDESHKDAH